MTETLTPQAGDVWEGADGTRRLVCNTGLMKFAVAADFQHVSDNDKESWLNWFATARRVFPPVPASPPVETITIPCTLKVHDGDCFIQGWLARIGGQNMERSVSVTVEKSQLSVPALPAVEVPTPSPTPLVQETDYLD